MDVVTVKENVSTVLQTLLSSCKLMGKRDDVITQFGHYENWLQSLALFLWA